MYFCGIYAVSGKIKRHVRKKPQKYLEGGGGQQRVKTLLDFFVFLVE
jgi:hypothetical protein